VISCVSDLTRNIKSSQTKEETFKNTTQSLSRTCSDSELCRDALNTKLNATSETVE